MAENHLISPLSPGLYIVATPIGTARDITLRALDILANCDVIAAEDTRTARKLMDIHGIAVNGRPMIAYHDHNGRTARPKVMEALRSGKSVAYVSEAGTPLVADPGYQLVRVARDEDLPVHAAPGASAVMAALCLSGLPTDRFMFLGFVPPAKAARARALSEVEAVDTTLVLFESPKRVESLLRDAARIMAPDRTVAVCRELTKKFEEVVHGTLGQLDQLLSKLTLKGEFVVIFGRPPLREVNEDDLTDMLRNEMESLSRKDAIAAVAQKTGMPRKQVYAIALGLDDEDD